MVRRWIRVREGFSRIAPSIKNKVKRQVSSNKEYEASNKDVVQVEQGGRTYTVTPTEVIDDEGNIVTGSAEANIRSKAESGITIEAGEANKERQFRNRVRALQSADILPIVGDARMVELDLQRVPKG